MSALKPGANREREGSSNGIYLDYNASTPVDPHVLEAIAPFFDVEFGHPSATHRWGVEAGTAVERARRQVAKTLGVKKSREESPAGTVVFTGGGTEANNLAILGAALARKTGGRRKIATFAAEHKAVLEPSRRLGEMDDFETVILPVDGAGRADLDALADCLDDDVLLVSMMFANNEVGTIQPVAEAAQLCRDRGALFHCDAIQAFGKIPIDVEVLGVDLLTISGHKLYAPKGVGALFIRDGVELFPIVSGGGQERGLRGGTQNVPGIVGLGKASELARRTMREEGERIGGLRDRFWSLLQGSMADIQRNSLGPDSHGPDSHGPDRHADCLAGTLNVSFPGISGRRLVIELARAGVACSAGSACSSEHSGDGGPEDLPSHVLTAMRFDEDRIRGAVRFSLGRFNEEPQIIRAAETVAAVVEELRNAG